jgi:hypothetical protein
MIPSKFQVEVALMGVILTLGIGWRVSDVHHQRTLGALQEKVRVQDSLLHVLQPKADSINAVLQHDTVTLTRTVRQYQTLHDSLIVQLHDTTKLLIRDTVVVLRYLRVADSTIGACTKSLADCVALSDNRAQQINALSIKVRATEQASPSSLRSFAGKVGWFAIGVGAGYLSHR